MYNQDSDTEKMIYNINKNQRDKMLGVKPEQPDLNRGRIEVPPKKHDTKSFESSGKKVTSSKKIDDVKLIKFLIKAGLIIAAGTALMAGIIRGAKDNRPIDPTTGFTLYENDEQTHKPSF